MSAHRGQRGERGAQSVELALWTPVVLVALLSALQLGLDVRADRQSGQFADVAAARVADGEAPADVAAALTAVLEGDGSVRISGGSVEVRVTAPSLAPWLPGGTRTTVLVVDLPPPAAGPAPGPAPAPRPDGPEERP